MQDMLCRCSGALGGRGVEIIAYFSVAVHRLLIREGVSKSLKRKLNGVFSNERIPCSLIDGVLKEVPR